MINSNRCPSLVLNADYRPLSYFPLSIWSWKDTVKAVFLDRVNIVEEYDQKVSSPSFEMYLPSIIAIILGRYISKEGEDTFWSYSSTMFTLSKKTALTVSFQLQIDKGK